MGIKRSEYKRRTKHVQLPAGESQLDGLFAKVPHFIRWQKVIGSHFVPRDEAHFSAPGWHINSKQYALFINDLKKYVDAAKAWQHVQIGSEKVHHLIEQVRRCLKCGYSRGAHCRRHSSEIKQAAAAWRKECTRSTKSFKQVKNRFMRKYPSAPSLLWHPVPTDSLSGSTPFFNVSLFSRHTGDARKYLWPLVDLVNELHWTTKGESRTNSRSPYLTVDQQRQCLRKSASGLSDKRVVERVFGPNVPDFDNLIHCVRRLRIRNGIRRHP